ncbi:ABC transporter ATP-binding protein [Vagococcus intermedius]|uniref:ABC transporter ATP-binding protein n=1 Tax=Vagococcus intermedius TaxID=2991418 RepID=A0AAF0CV60_9ENTE|nr:ABC transporter ATP-binding protein [Vagococcus intermedius]WEG73539.1 ABC transporter ATP-binding protein [Vagococcus intermedius]WEG75621.1 ABC transporter ATP-binding protein [Vagococcus intermedius]
MEQAILEIDRITKVYGTKLNPVRVLEDISFSIDQGEFVGIMGPSGAGKTTLLNLISTIDRPTTGKILINQTDVTRMREKKLTTFRREQLGFIFQDFNLLESLNVKDNILLPLALERIRYQEMMERVTYVTKILGIEHLLDKAIVDISIGQKQRVAAARALITQPKLILADEPTGSLDSKSATELLQYLTAVNQQEQATILMVTHDAFTASYCQRILFIKDGAIFSEIVRQGTRKEFFQKIMDMQTAIGGGISYDLY